jgi:Raf kinase inhibitor-like YbhB/YbcL family protein
MCQLIAMTILLTMPARAIQSDGVRAKGSTQSAVSALSITTSAFSDGALIPDRFTVLASNPVSPALQWTGVPDGTISFVLILHDPDGAPQKKVEDWLHWLIFNIPGSARGLPEGVPIRAQLPDGTIQAMNRGINGYLGPGAPASGPYHHYMFELFALDTTLDLGADATRAEVLKAIDGHILGKSVTVGRFHR